MSIPAQQLELRTGDIGLVFHKGSGRASMTWEVYHSGLDETVARGTVGVTLPTLDAAEIERRSQALMQAAETEATGVRRRHKAIPQIGDYSAWDADLILDGWWIDGTLMRHPICGQFPGTDISESSLAARTNAVLDRVLGPSTWFWAEASGPNEATIRCVPVPGATTYNLYNMDTLLQSGLGSGWPGGQQVTLLAGDYALRMAAVDGTGQVGVPSMAVAVTVSATGDPMASPADYVDRLASTISTVRAFQAEPDKRALWAFLDRIKRWLVYSG